MTARARLLSIKDVAAELGLAVKTIRNQWWCWSRGLEAGKFHSPIPFRRFGGRVVVQRTDFEVWFAAEIEWSKP
jgi:hypothetical protein